MIRNRLPLHRQVRFKLTGTIITILILSSFFSHQFDKRFTKREVERLISSQFTNAASITENFIDFVGQSGLMAAKSLAEDQQLQVLLSQQDTSALTHYFSTTLDRISADTAILLDNQGNILAVSGYPKETGNLRSLILVRDSLAAGQPIFSIVQDMETFILFSSAPILLNSDKSKQAGLILTGYALNNTFVDNLKKNTNIDMAIVRERSIIAGTLLQDGKRLNTLPIPFAEYRMILQNPDGLFQTEIDETPYYIKASRFKAMQENMSGSLLLAYSQQELLASETILQKHHMLLHFASLSILISALLFISRRFLGPIDQLVKATGNIDLGDLTARATVTGNDEFTLLGMQFNSMIDGLQEKDEALRNANRDLEKQVATRTRELDEKNSLLDSILYATTDLAIIATDARLQINYFNPNAEQLFQMGKENIIGQNVSVLHTLFSVDVRRFEKSLRNLHHQQSHSFSFQMAFSGKQKRIEAQINSLQGSSKEPIGYVLVAKDVTRHYEQEAAHKIMEEKLQRARKMEAIGLMAGGIAHDLNNILTGMLGYPELLLMELPQESPLRRPISAIHKSGTHAADLAADLLTVARGVAASKETLNLNNLIVEYLNSAEHQNLMSRHQEVTCTSNLDPEISPIFCSKLHIRKCILYLTINAAEAIEQEGLITLATRNQFIEDNTEEEQVLAQGDYAVFSITDSGEGISEEDIQRIFDPFYTKKVLGRSSTGMGLSVIWNTVEEHGGSITVQSSDQGTCFEMYLPVSNDSEQAGTERKTDLQN